MGNQLRLLPPGALGNAVLPFAEDAEGTVNSATFLAELIDLKGGYHLAEALADLDCVVEPVPDAAQTAGQRLDGVLAALEEIAVNRRVARRNAFKRRYRFPTPARLLTLLQEAEALDGVALRRVARFAWAPIADFLEVWTKRARFDIRALRDDALRALTDRGGDGARLAALEQALEESTRRPLEALYRRVPTAIEQRFAKALTARVAQLGGRGALSLEALEPWFEERGWIRALFDDAWALTEGVVGGERRRLEALIEAGRACG